MDIMDHIKEYAYDEINDVEKYMNLSDNAKVENLFDYSGVLKDIAHDEYSHAKYLISMLEEHGEIDDNLKSKWKECQEHFRDR